MPSIAGNMKLLKFKIQQILKFQIDLAHAKMITIWKLHTWATKVAKDDNWKAVL